MVHEAEQPDRTLTTTVISRGTDLPPAEIDAAVDRLLDVGLIRRLPNGGLVTAAPDETLPGALGPLEREISERRALMAETREFILSFLPAYERIHGPEASQPRFTVVRGLSEARAVIAGLTARAREEILTAQPGGPRDGAALEEAMSRDPDALRRGVRMRILCQHTARSSLGASAYIDRVTALGARVRTIDDHFTRVLVFDRETAVLAVPGDPRAAAVVREANVVSFIRETYERLWLSAEPLSARGDHREEVVSDIRQAITRLLTEGLTDASIAMRLGMSVRTCRRHIADIMAGLDAQSRFQAGYLLARARQG
ncbi:LuxR C-terminal-related transcriptional regulator [Streptomyces sp. TRM64462]|uniref:LuxR C-terminal-related transcriptional regulator n=1 Tax=Streptomyces sp. TRM64462 TaxID=2741726 RepID=UPI001586858B|nr:LuxR C-terminal-related transcriptional regulator [Streptomyces sp. TRM64462]